MEPALVRSAYFIGRQMSRASRRHNDTGRCRVGSIRMLGALNSIGPPNDFTRGLLSLNSWETVMPPPSAAAACDLAASRRPDCHLQQGGTAECGQ